MGGSAEAYFTSITEAINDIDPEIASKITNTMTDRHIVNQAVDELIETEIGKPLNKYRCAMHPLDSFHKSCDKVLATEECGMAEKFPQMPYQHRSESMPQALLRTLDKLFHDQQVNLGEELRAYLKQQGFGSEEKETLYLRWVGNKFNILFRNATYTYLYTPYIITFLTKYKKSPNLAARAVFYMLESGACNEAFKCLATIDKYITGPWMSVAGKESQILNTNEHFNTARMNIQAWIEDPLPILTGRGDDCFGREIKTHQLFTERVSEEGEPQESAVRLMQKLLDAILTIINRQLQDQLPGGIFWEPSQAVKDASKSCNATNMSGERKFAKMKAIQQRAPAMKMTKIEGRKMFKSNNLVEKLKTKSEEELARDINWATTEGRRIRQKDKEREWKYRDSVRERLDQCRRSLSKKEQKAREDMEDIVENALKYGFWMTAKDRESSTRHLSKTKKVEVLKLHIKLRTQMLKVKVEGEKVKVSKATPEELKDYLVLLMKESVPEEKVPLLQVFMNPTSVVGKTVVHTFEDANGHDRIWKGAITKVVVNKHGKEEFEFVYHDSPDQPCYIEAEEIIVDMALGDLSLQ